MIPPPPAYTIAYNSPAIINPGKYPYIWSESSPEEGAEEEEEQGLIHELFGASKQQS